MRLTLVGLLRSLSSTALNGLRNVVCGVPIVYVRAEQYRVGWKRLLDGLHFGLLVVLFCSVLCLCLGGSSVSSIVCMWLKISR